jgi:hypothetical protein
MVCAVVTKRQQEVKGNHPKNAGELDLEQGTAPSSTGPFLNLVDVNGLTAFMFVSKNGAAE